MTVCVGYLLTVTSKDGTVLYTANLRGGSLAGALFEASERVMVVLGHHPQHDLVAKLEGQAN